MTAVRGGRIALVERRRSFALFGGARLPPRVLAAHGLLVLALALSVFALGSFYASALSFSTALLAVACGLAWWPSEPRRLRTAARVLAVVATALPAYTFLQSLPLPLAMVSALAPANGDVWVRALRPLHEAPPPFVSLSLDPGNTRVEVLRGVTYLLAFLTALRLSARRGGATLFCSAIALTGGLLALVTVAHGAFDAQKVFGLYRPLTPVPARDIGPLLNPNHLAAYLNIALCLGLGIALSTQNASVRIGAAILVAGLGAFQVWVGSRAGIALLVFELPFVTLLSRFRDGSAARVRTARVVVGGLVGVAVVGMLVLGASTSAVTELTNTDTSKLKGALDAMRLVRGHEIFGVGRGAFESTYPSVQGLHGYWTWTNPENIVPQWATEWGIPVSAAALAAILYALRPGVYASASRSAAGPWAALIVTGVHNLVDFNSEMPGVTVALAVCAGVVVASRPSDDAVLAVGRRWPRRLALLTAAAAVPAIVWAAPSFGHDLLHDRLRMRASADDGSLPREVFRAEVREVTLRHPAERYFSYVAAYRAARIPNENPIGWIGLALERSPTYGRAHALLGDALAERAPAQARLEYRVAMSDEPDMANEVALKASRIVHNISSALEVVPPGPLGLPVLATLARSVKDRLPSTATALDREALKRDPTQADPTLRVLEAARTDIEGGPLAPWCRDGACLATGLATAARLQAERPGMCTPFTERALLLSSAGQTSDAISLLKAAVDGATDRAVCLRALVALAVQSHDRANAEHAIDGLIHACTTADECTQFEAEAAQAEERLGDLGLALVHYRRVLGRAPGRKDIEESVARLAARFEQRR